MGKYIVQRDKGWPVTDDPKPQYAFGETFDPDPDTTDSETQKVTLGAINEKMCATGVESGYIALFVEDKKKKADDDGAHTQGGVKAPVPVVITKKMRDGLAAAGFTTEQIDAMTPQEANDALAKK